MHHRIHTAGFPQSGKPELFIAFHKKGSFLLKEYGISQVNIHLAGIRLHLAEIGIYRRIQDHCWCEHCLAGDTELRFFQCCDQFPILPLLELGRGKGGQDLVSRLEFQSFIDHSCHLLQKSAAFGIQSGEGGFFR